MTKGDTFFYVALSLILLSGAYSLYLAVMLDRALKLIEKTKTRNRKIGSATFLGGRIFAQKSLLLIMSVGLGILILSTPDERQLCYYQATTTSQTTTMATKT